MNLLLVRHALAEEREAFATTGQPDTARPLTDRGRRQMRRGARGLRQLVPKLDILATSPLVRAAQTARILRDAYGGPDPILTESLAPGGGPHAIGEWLASLETRGTVALVGHEPDLSEIATWLLSGKRTPLLRMGKAGACLLEFDDEVAAGLATLRWLLRGRPLRDLGRRR